MGGGWKGKEGWEEGGEDKETADSLQELTLTCAGIAHNTDVDVSSQRHPLGRHLPDPSHQLQQQAFLDDLMPIHHRRQTIHQPRINMVTMHHHLQILNLRRRQALQIRVLRVIPFLHIHPSCGRLIQTCQNVIGLPVQLLVR